MVPIAPALAAYLREAIDQSSSELVFPWSDGSMRSPECDPEKVLRRALARAGLVEGYDHSCRRCKSRGTPASPGVPATVPQASNQTLRMIVSTGCPAACTPRTASTSRW